VDFTAGIEPEEVKVLADSGEATLTLVTGSPSYFLGPPPRKFIATRAGFLDDTGPALHENQYSPS